VAYDRAPKQGARVVVDGSPTLRQRELGKRLRELRKEHGLTVEDVANELLCSPAKISRLETGARRPNLRDVRDLCKLYHVDEAISAELMNLVKEARAQGWWTQYVDLNLDPYLGLEQEAKAITCYAMHYLPALLQTEDYARTIIRAIARKMDPAIHDQRVEVRMKRQQLLDKANRPVYSVLLDEAVIQRPVGGRQKMAAQLDKIIELSSSGKIAIQVIPFDAGADAAADAHFVMLEFEDAAMQPPIVFLEGLTGNQYIERETDIGRYREAIAYLRGCALSPRESVSRIEEQRKAFASE
jgi:transcriptional regulator with XRE-family HTH domain